MKSRLKHTRIVIRHLKLLTWMNIAIQASFPVATAFTPAIAGTVSDNYLLQNQVENTLQTRVYTLREGETAVSVANKYHMTLDMLRKLNQFRTFARGFEHLQRGDDVDVPVAPLPKVRWDEGPAALMLGKQDYDTQARKVAGYASQAGSNLANGAGKDAATSMARGIATSAFGGDIQQWLSRFGTARVQLDADKKLSLKNSQLDLLIPLHEQKNSLVFTQSSIHRTDDRAQSNLGVGYRWFASDWMLGGNSFLDYDLSRDHARLGLGGEYWRDFLKLGVNTYYGITRWKNSPDLVDYKERPANGWDIRVQAWLPALPQLGGQLAYEQYYGDEVALFGRDNRQKNPHAITAGINYTPIPLLTFSTERRQGKADENDTRFGVDMNYQLGVPWQQQINSDAVVPMRSLAGSRYDLVERNNNIVLEYRKKEVIHLKMADLVTGYAGEQKSLGVSVNSKYGLERIDWSASSLIAAGGKIVQNGNDWAVIMPAYRSDTEGGNNYTVSGVAVDKKGNFSGRVDTQVTVTQAAIDLNTSTLSPPAATLLANGVSQQEFVLKVNDKKGLPVDIAENEISLEKTSKLGGNHSATVSAFTRRAAGEYVMTVTSGTMPETFTITPSARNKNFASASVTLAADKATALVDALDLVKDNAIADGKSQNRLRVTVVDAENNPIPGQSVSLQADNGANVAKSAITEADGTVIVPVTSSHAGETTVSASINDKGGKTLKLSFSPDHSTARIENKELSVLPEVSLADGKTQKTVTVRVTDAKGNAVPDMTVTFSADNGASFTENTLKTNAVGVITTTLTSTFAGLSHVTASVNNLSITKNTSFIGNKATAVVTAVDTSATSGIADGATAVIFRAQIKDQCGNPLSGIPVDWKSNKDNSIVSFSHTQTLTSEKGVAEVRVTSTRAYSDVVVTASTNASSKSASPFIFVADQQNPVIRALSSNKQTLTANGTDTADLMVSVTDTNGNPLSGVEVSLSNNNDADITPSHPVTGGNGVASASLTTYHAGQMTVSATLNKGKENTLSLQAISDEQTAVVTVTADKASVTAGQAQPVTLTATVVDENNNPVSGTSVAWHTNYNQLSHTVSQTNAEGKATVKLSGTQAILTTVTAVLYNGHEGSTQVAFGPGEPANEHSQLSISPQSITADGKTKALASLILRDTWGNPVPGKTVDWSTNTKAGIRFSPLEKGEGIYQSYVTGTIEGSWLLNAQSGAVHLQTPLVLLANQDTAHIDHVVVLGPGTAKANGHEMVTIRVQVKDKNGNTKLKGVTVGWDTTLGTLSSRLSSTNENGVAEIKLSSRTAGKALVSSILGGEAPVAADKSVNFEAGDISADKSSISISPTSIVAGKENATLIVTTRDTEGNLLTGLKDQIKEAFIPDLNMTVSAFREVSSGVYESTVSGRKAGSTQVSADVNSIRINHTTSLMLRADNDSAIVKGSISVTPIAAKVGDFVTYSALLTDINGNALGAGIPVTWSANEGSVLRSQMTRTDDSGTVRVTLSRQQAGPARVNLILPSGNTPAPDVIFSAGDVDEKRSELTLSPSVIVAGKDTATLTLTLRDSNGNLLTGKNVSGHSDNKNVKVSESQTSSSAPGSYTMAVSSDKAGSAKLSVQVGDKVLSKSRILTVKGDTGSWKLSAVAPDKTSLAAGDGKGVTYRATVTDVYGNPLNNTVVSWQLHGQAESYEPTTRTNENGVATTTVRSNTTGLLQMTAYLDADNHIQASNVTVVAGDIKNATFVADKTRIGSDGKEVVKLTVSLEDSYGNPVAGKKVTIVEADSLTGFKLSDVRELQNGHYMATGTATNKGGVTLSALVDGKKTGNSVKITVGAITPDLRFDNAEQTATWTRNFVASQAVRGMPHGLEEKWSSSNGTIATVDENGNVTLLKSGTTRITVYTPGDNQYDPAMASYKLSISKADPGLRAGTGEPIVATWADGKEQSIAGTYTNSDVQGALVPKYTSQNTDVVTLDGTGRLTGVKPGATTVIVSTPETDQFLAASADVTYVLNKAKVDIKFNVGVVETTDEDVFVLQNPVISLTSQASIKWSSSNSNVIKISDSGAQGVGKGQSRLTLTVLANDYYESSAGYYDVKVYTKPSVNLGLLSYVNKGQKVTSGRWTPVFTDDTLSVNWSVDTSDEFSKAERVTVYVMDEKNNILATSKAEESPFGSNTTTFPPISSLWGKTIHVKMIAEGYGKLVTSELSRAITVENLEPYEIWSSLVVRSHSETHTINGKDTACQETLVGLDHWNKAIITGERISFGGKRLISPMSLKAVVKATQNGEISATGDFSESYEDIYTDKSVAFGSKQIATSCWRNHVGGYAIGISVHYSGADYIYWQTAHGWGGNGAGMYIDFVDNY
ncbi:hypothetical protein JNC30_004660 [Salmonella enterica]|nr:hypothetical protein [Salmonella enterica]EGM3390130.1 hypothetical protein [Salmonella enterica]EHE3387872.1 hypothetical protein [Salmonella enterica]